jgi:hypothetical protein
MVAFVFDVDDTAVRCYPYLKSKAFRTMPLTDFYYLSQHDKAPVHTMVFQFYTYLKWRGFKVYLYL